MALNIYTVAETASILKVTQRTVLTYIYSGDLKASKLGGRWRVTEEDIKEMLQAKQEKQPDTQR